MLTGNKKKLVRRLKIAEGQIRGLQKMVEEDKYCIDVIAQTSAVKQALSNIEDILLENHLTTSSLNQIRAGRSEKATQEIIKVFKLKRK